MNQEIKDKAKKYSEQFIWTLDEMEAAELTRCSMRFTDPADLTFPLMDFYFDHMLSRILKHAEVVAARYKSWGRTYEEFKPYIAHFVGWDSFVSKDEQPMLHSTAAYDLMLDKLYEACERGEATGRRRSPRLQKSKLVSDIMNEC